MSQLEERGAQVIDARPKNHGGIKPGDKVSHPEHGTGEVMHLDHVHDEVVFKAKGAIVGAHHSTLKKVTESMDKTQIALAILSKDATKLAEAKGAIKALLDARAAQFRQESSKFVARSLFESAEQVDEAQPPEMREAKAIVKKHQTGQTKKDDEGDKHDTQHAVHKSKREALHHDLVKAGFKHSEDDIVHKYHKGKARVAVTKETGGDGRYNETPDDHHDVGVGHSYGKDW